MRIPSAILTLVVGMALVLLGQWVANDVNLLPESASVNAPVYDELFRVLVAIGTMLLAMTRPIRACTECSFAATLLFCTIVAVGVTYGGFIVPLNDIQRTWTPTSCTFTAPMTFDRVKRGKHS